MDHTKDIAQARAAIPKIARDHIGAELRALYAPSMVEPAPTALLDLIARLTALDGQPATAADDFKAGLMENLAFLRGFAMSLAGNHATADDLVQETLVKGWANQARFQPGTNLRAWLCTILRNQFYSDRRKRSREVEDADDALAMRLTAPPAQEAASDLGRVGQQVARLSPAMRESLMLVAAQGLTYEAAAELLGCQVGTVKSRVNRARALLADRLGMPARSEAV